ncbi:MAG: hypothetical protein KZQ75_08725 [Candidatus Thiodiazotropha sp. (ex Myrtea spinifera)]|nr:hypothetical protein [Candidatus Thiodiazotropha sp. (ex Myrtea spinifera)]MCU7830374.1 hypothetical protein [Candidatus Thiodiazotropha sp. (ex Myrtea sp. 'scaly one' KF741663)]
MERHKLIALTIFVFVSLYLGVRDGFEEAVAQQLILAVLLIPILFYRVVAFFSGFGFPEYFARDFKSENHPGPYAIFFWLLFLIACLFMIFEWSLY